MFSQSWRLIKRLTGGLVLFLGLLGLVEVLRAGLFLYRLNPWAAAAFGALILAGLLYLVGEWRRLPRVLQPPREPLNSAADIRVWLRYARYLARYLERLARNPNLDAAARAQGLAAAAGLREVLAHHPLRADLEREIARAEQETVTPLLAGLRRTAEAEVRRCVRDVMLGVTLSPYHSIDLLIVLYRNGAMVLRVSRVFAARPRAREEWLIVRDVIRVMAAVNLFHVSRMIFERLFTSVPLLGGSMHDIGQGLGAGLLTSAAGHAAIERCAAFRGWNRAQAVVNLAGQARRFFGDVRRIFTTDILPELKPRLRSEA
ncbi:MAG: DUF697 domain-containing protein, partial [Candidatus Marinimicrobia bacterium]|nr:DUF697 domain-containing protein [Candidatus Neomarinimicrobiota bacterium]